MYSDDEECGFGLGRRGASAGRSPTPPARQRGGEAGSSKGDSRGGDRFRERDVLGGRGSRGEGRGGDRFGDRGGRGQQRQRTTGRELPKLNSIHKGSVVSVRDFGAFVRLGDGDVYKDGLLHISRMSATSRVDKVEDVLREGENVWVKVVEVKEEEGKHSLDMRFVGQRDGEDKDPNNTQADSGGSGKGKGRALDPIRIGAVQDTTCGRCGARGHTSRECFAQKGQHFELVEDPPEESTFDRPVDNVPWQKLKEVKDALKAYMKGKAQGGVSSSSSSSSSSEDKKKKKKKKKEKDKEKKEKKVKKKEKKKKEKDKKKQIKKE